MTGYWATTKYCTMAMRSTSVTGCLIVAAATSLVVWRFVYAHTQPGTIQWYLHDAKARGAKSVVIDRGAVGIPPVVSSLRDALRHYTVLIAVPQASRAFIADNANINTWYDCKIVKIIADSPLSRTIVSSPEIPWTVLASRLLSSSKDRFLLIRRGGSVTRDGISIESTGSGYTFNVGAKYLLFVDFNARRNAGTIPLAGC